MDKRIIRIKTDERTQLITVETSATTLGELKAEVKDVKWSDATVVVKETKLGLPMDESPLPVGNSILFVYPKKSKSGAYVELSGKEAKSKIKELRASGVTIPFNYTHASTERLNEFLKDYAASTVKKSKRVEKASPVVAEMPTPCCKDHADATVLNLKPGKYLLYIEGNTTEVVREIIVEKVPEGYIDMRILVDTTTIDMVNDEYKNIKSKI